MQSETEKYLIKKARHGYRGGPVASIALYGPDDKRATKLVVAFLADQHAEPREVKTLRSNGDVRRDPAVFQELKAFLEGATYKTLVFPNVLVGCAHDQGTDYTGPFCPECTYWQGRDRLQALKQRTGRHP